MLGHLERGACGSSLCAGKIVHEIDDPDG